MASSTSLYPFCIVNTCLSHVPLDEYFLLCVWYVDLLSTFLGYPDIHSGSEDLQHAEGEALVSIQILSIQFVLSVHMQVEQDGARENCMRVCSCSGQKNPTTNIELLMHDCTDQTLHTLSPTTVTLALTWCVSGIKVCQWMCVCVIMSMHIWICLCVCVCVKERASISPRSPCCHTCWRSCLGSFVSASSVLTGISPESPASPCAPSGTS